MVPDFLTIAEAARLIERKELSPIELVESRLDRIARLDGRLNSFIRVLAEEARAEARAAEAEIAADRYRGPLHGIPIGLKDIYETAGVATTGHSKVMHRGVRRQFHLVPDPVLTLEEDAELSVGVDQHRSGTLPRIGLNSLTH